MLEKSVRSIRSFSTVFVNSRSFLHASVFAAALWHPLIPAVAEQPTAASREFSGSIIKQVNGKKYQAQIFAKEDRLRFEYKYAIRTDYGYAGIEIIRLDLGEAWYLLAQRKELLVTPLDPDDVLPIEPALPGERSRTLVGEATVADRAAQLYGSQNGPAWPDRAMVRMGRRRHGRRPQAGESRSRLVYRLRTDQMVSTTHSILQ